MVYIYIYISAAYVLEREKRRERKSGGPETHCMGGMARSYISGFECSQSVPPRVLVEVMHKNGINSYDVGSAAL